MYSITKSNSSLYELQEKKFALKSFVGFKNSSKPTQL